MVIVIMVFHNDSNWSEMDTTHGNNTDWGRTIIDCASTTVMVYITRIEFSSRTRVNYSQGLSR